jgi:hypothetical protein
MITLSNILFGIIFVILVDLIYLESCVFYTLAKGTCCENLKYRFYSTKKYIL